MKYKNVTSKALEMLFKWHQSRNDPATLLIMNHILAFYEHLTPLDLLN